MAQGSTEMHHRREVLLFLLLCAIWFAGLTLSRTVIAQEEPSTLIGENLTALLQRVHANVVANDELARQYASDETTHAISLNQKGKKIWEHSAKFECANIGGKPYNHMVEENGKPLDAKKLEAEQKRQDTLSELGLGQDFVIDVRNLNPRDAIRSALPICCLTAMFDNRVLKHEQINGRDNLVVESVPKANAIPSSPQERTALDWKETVWIDVHDLTPARYEVSLLNDKDSLPRLLKGSKFRRDFVRLERTSDSKDHSSETVWLLSCSEGHFNAKVAWYRQFETYESTEYNYKKFKADVRLLGNSVQEIPDNGTVQKP
jgi:hypothetical protein